MKAITESTAVSIGLLMAIIGGAGFVARSSFQGEANANDIRELKRKQDAIEIIQTDLAVIKTKLEAIEKSISNRRQ